MLRGKENIEEELSVSPSLEEKELVMEIEEDNEQIQSHIQIPAVPTFECDICGRDDFKSPHARNGHKPSCKKKNRRRKKSSTSPSKKKAKSSKEIVGLTM